MKRVLKALTRSSGRKATVVAAAAMLLAALALGGPAWAVVISNPGSISIPSQGQATPYPATVNVSGLSGTITDLNVVGPCPVDAFNNAAFGALSSSNPTQPLPPEYPADKAFFTVTFFYNESPR